MMFSLRFVVVTLTVFSFACVSSSEHVESKAQSLHSRSKDQSIYGTRFSNVTWNNEKWQLSTTELDQGHYQSRMAIANGYIGINVAALGPFFEVDTPVDGDILNGWPLFARRQTFATVGGFWDSQPQTNGSNFPWLYQYGGESVISGIPHWSGILIQIGKDHILDASTNASEISNFTSTLDVKRGVTNWEFTWTPDDSLGSLYIKYQMFAHKLHVNQALVQLIVTAENDLNVTIVNVLDGDCAVRTTFAEKGEENGLIYSAVKPVGIANVTAYIYAGLQGTVYWNASNSRVVTPSESIGKNQSSIGQAFDTQLSGGEEYIINKFVGIASSDGFSNPQTIARNAASAAAKSGYDASFKSHVAEWEEVLPSDSVDDFSFPENGSLPLDDNIVELAISAVLNPYYLLQNTIGQNALSLVNNASINSHSIAVGGLASDSYAGLIFWDADVWMQPGLVASHPQAAKGIANYREERFGQAQENVKTAYQSSKNDTSFSSSSAVFPWTSGRFGNCTGTGPCWDYEYHINGDIAQMLANYWVASGDSATFKKNYFPIYDAIASLYSEVLTPNGSFYSLTNMTDPDEYANHVDNGGFTMPLIADTLTNANRFRSMFGLTQDSNWTTQAENVFIGRNDDVGIVLEYSTMNGSIDVKQADVVLDTYPLRYKTNYTQENSLNDLDYYAAKQSLDGPAMTYAIFSIVANEVSPSGCSAYTYHQYSTQPYSRGPWFQFSEQLTDDYANNGGTHPAYPFLTGHGGANQVVLFGYLGLRYVPDFNLYVDPSIPPQIPQIRYRTFYWHGWPISAFSNATHTTLTRLTSPLPGANTTFTTVPIPVLVGSDPQNRTTYSLPSNSSITIQNRQPGLIPTISGNLFQCSSVKSLDEYEPGQFPIAAVDGAASTKWQPSSASTNASITVEIPSSAVGQRIKAIYFDWGSMPPATFSVFLHNGSNPYTVTGDNTTSVLTVAAQYHVTISSPYNYSQQNEIKAPQSNISWYAVQSELYAAEYATLQIRGNLAYGSEEKEIFNSSQPGGSVAEWALLNELSPIETRRDQLGFESGKPGEFLREVQGALASTGTGLGARSNSGFGAKMRPRSVGRVKR